MGARAFLVACLALALAACSTPTPYAPAGGAGDYGYRVQRIEGERFRVSFAGNMLTDRNTVENYLLYRAAELTLARAADYFTVVSRAVVADITYRTSYDGWPHHWPYRYDDRYWWPGYRPWPPVGGTTRAVTRYDAHAEIVLHSGRKPADDVNAFDAREVVRNLGAAIIRPAPPG